MKTILHKAGTRGGAEHGWLSSRHTLLLSANATAAPTTVTQDDFPQALINMRFEFAK